MPTVKELEAERAKILQEIESKAKRNNSDEPPSLKDFLSSAQEVMKDERVNIESMSTSGSGNFIDEFADDDIIMQSDINYQPRKAATETPASSRVEPTPASDNRYAGYTGQSEPAKSSPPAAQPNKLVVIGVILMLGLLATVLAVMFIGYNSLQKQIREVVDAKNDTQEQVFALQEEVIKLQNQTGLSESAGQRFELIEQQLTQQNKQIERILLQLKEQKTLSGNANAAQIESGSLLLSEAMLDQKLQKFSEKLAYQIEQKIDLKLAGIIQRLEKQEENNTIVGSTKISTPVKINQEDEGAVVIEPAEPDLPMVPTQTLANTRAATIPLEPETGTTKAEQKLLTLAQPSRETKFEKPVPIDPDFPEDVKWLLGEPSMHYTMQLASMPSKASLEKMKRDLRLTEARIIPQNYKGKVNYILVLDSLISRAAASSEAKKVKETLGISPWVRRISDVSKKIVVENSD